MKKQLLIGAIATSAISAANFVVAPEANALDLTPSGNNCSVVVTDPLYDSCIGFFDGNDSQLADSEEWEAFLGEEFGGEWEDLGKVDAEEANPNDFFSILTTDDFESGEIDFTALFTETYGTGYDLIVSFKAGNEFSFYQFDGDLDFDPLLFDTPNSSGLSHANLYVSPTDVVPTPAAVLPIIGGLFGAASRRKNGESEDA